ncbi:MAG: radical SAM protein [Victivallales bacterium]
MNVALVYVNSTNCVGRGVGYVAGAIRNGGHLLDFYDTNKMSEKNIIGKICSSYAEVLMVSSFSINFTLALSIIKGIKKKRDIPVLLGGIHATIMKERLLLEHRGIDFLCIGEGESMVIEFLDNIKSGNIYNTKNLAYRKDNKICINEISNPEDLSKLPEFPWDLFSSNAVVQDDDGFLYFTATRGCPFTCTYCSNTSYLELYGKKYLRSRPVNDVMDELRYLANKYKPGLIYFADEMILSDKDYAVRLLLEYKRNFTIPYGCMCRAEYIDENIATLFSQTGCVYVGMGVECGNEQFRKEHLNRFVTNERIISAFSLLSKEKIYTCSFNMIGYPFGFDDELTDETIKFNKQLNPDSVQISIYYPFPGTKLYDKCVEENLIDDTVNASNYYSESILKGKHLKDKIESIRKIFPNKPYIPSGWKKRKSLMKTLRKYSYLIPPKVRTFIKNTVK